MLGWLKRLGRLIAKAFGLAREAGLTDAIIERAVDLARMAAAMFVGNDQRREWVVATLVARGVPESIARLAVELAVQILKRERQDADDEP